ncbi:MAG: hypothetical protein HYR51_08320 [Candidatus Rokubacteria bacterium]|nr:hypothetical protein [Candidatus Rokubacteria bacterium]
MASLHGVRHRLGILGEFFGYLHRARLWWMIPMFVVVFFFGLLLVLGQSSALAPFIYTLF